MRRDKVFVQQPLSYFFWERVPRPSRVRKLCVPSVSQRWQLVRSQQAEPGAARIEGRIDVEQSVALSEPVAACAGLGDGAVVVQVRDVKQLVVVEAVFAAEGDVGFDVVELAEFGGEGDVAGVVEGG